ncbi:diacylglycerol/lipid kinase family protein [Terrisporobacter sp.]
MYYFLVNPNSRSGRGMNIWMDVDKELKNRNIEYEVFFTTKEKNATVITKKLLENKNHLKLTVIGGDGTVNEAINGIDDFSKVIFSYLPTGSSNDFARGLSLKKDIKNSLDNIINPKHYDYVDIGQVSNNQKSRYFIVSCGIGFDAEVCFEALNSSIKEKLNKINLGKLSYVGIALKRLLFFKLFSLKIKRDNENMQEFNKVIFMSFMNMPCEGGGLNLCPKASYNDAILDTCLVHRIAKFIVCILLPTAYKGKHVFFRGVNINTCKEMNIKTNVPVAVHTDGEYFGYEDDISIRYANKKLKIIRY